MTDKPDRPAEKRAPINRREFLTLAWLASLGFLTLDIAGVSYLFSIPIFKEGEFGGVVDMGTVSELPPAGTAPANHPKVKIWLSNTDEGLVALYKVCTHLGCLYNWNNQEGKFICPCHGSQFTAEGQYIQGPAPRSLDKFAVSAINSQTGEVLAGPTAGPMLLEGVPADAIIQVNTGDKTKGAPKA
ncbi:MAG: hypothetical protein A2W36_05205 [Chloroflexi bacterium RBG_16_58_14]|nr:MAG: hypothetical protein A2W36_05205 [Chloroflexi bacterium RBG_16_58_14]